MSSHSAGGGVGRAIDLADLVQAHGCIENRINNAVPGENLERASQDRARLGVQRQGAVVFEHHDRDVVVLQPQCGREPDGSTANNRDGQHLVGVHVCTPNARSRDSTEPVIEPASESRNINGPTTSSG